MDGNDKIELVKNKLKLEIRLTSSRLSTLELELTELELFGGDAEYIDHIKKSIEQTKEVIEELENLEKLAGLATTDVGALLVYALMLKESYWHFT